MNKEKAQQRKQKEAEEAKAHRKRQEDEEQSKKLGGRMLSMLVKLRQNETPRDISLAGLELGGPRTRILSNHVAVNSTLMCLHLSRKGIADVDGVEIAKML